MGNLRQQKRLIKNQEKLKRWHLKALNRILAQSPKFNIMCFFFKTQMMSFLCVWKLCASCLQTSTWWKEKENKKLAFIHSFIYLFLWTSANFNRTLSDYLWIRISHVSDCIFTLHLVWHPGNRPHQNSLVSHWQTTRNMTHFFFGGGVRLCSKFTQTFPVLALDGGFTDWLVSSGQLRTNQLNLYL